MDENAIVPDDKDWTWVLDRPCPECGFDVAAIDVARVGSLIRENASAWTGVLGRPEPVLKRRPQPDRWSALEYAAHVRDVYRLYLERLSLMLAENDPLYPNWDQDETAVADAYRAQDPATVARELLDAAGDLAAAFDAVRPDQWGRPGRRSDGATFTVESFARYLIHDPVHHLWDVGAGRA